MEHLELVLLGLLVSVAALAVLAQRLRVPYPILLVLGGLALGWVPGVPTLALDPDLVLLIFLPPLLYAAALFSNARELRRNVRPIGLLAVGLVLATTVAVAVPAHYVIGLPWPVAFVLGAIVSPTDAVAPATIVRRLGVPRRIVTIIEGENLTNDWTALVLYRFAVTAVVTGTFSLVEAGLQFVLTGVGGLVIGLAVGRIVAAVRRRLDDPPTEITISLLTSYAAYLPAEQLEVSGVIAAVTVGLYMAWHAPELTTPSLRLQTYAIWEILQFVLNALLFVLIGLQLPAVIEAIRGESELELLAWAVLIGAIVIATRVVWVFALTYGPRRAFPRLRERDPDPPWQQTMVVAWSGMRGGVSLAAALAIPLSAEGGGFPNRDVLIFLTFTTILATLVLQGLSLPPLIKALGVEDDGIGEREESAARLHTAKAALQRIDELGGEDWTNDDTLERVRGMFDFRRRRFVARLDGGGDGDGYEERSSTYQRLMHELYAAQRRSLLELRNEGRIADEVMRRVERDLDLEESRLDQ